MINICQNCKKMKSKFICRRCSRRICNNCYFHHSLCTQCAKILGKIK